MNKEDPVLSAMSEELRQRIKQTFDLTDLRTLQGLPERLAKMGHTSAASALEQLIEADATQIPESAEKEVSKPEPVFLSGSKHVN